MKELCRYQINTERKNKWTNNWKTRDSMNHDSNLFWKNMINVFLFDSMYPCVCLLICCFLLIFQLFGHLLIYFYVSFICYSCLCCFLFSNSYQFYLIYLFTSSSEEPGENGAGTCPTHRPQTSSPRAPSTWARRGVTLCRAQRITFWKKKATFLKLIATQWKQGANFWGMSGELFTATALCPENSCMLSSYLSCNRSPDAWALALWDSLRPDDDDACCSLLGIQK